MIPRGKVGIIVAASTARSASSTDELFGVIVAMSVVTTLTAGTRAPRHGVNAIALRTVTAGTAN